MSLRPTQLLAFLFVLGCGSRPPQEAAPQKTAPEVKATEPKASPEKAAADKAAPAQPAPAAASTRQAGAALVFDPPQDWVVETPSSNMRKAQYKLPHSAGDAEDGDCVVYYFGASGGGGVDANVERWCSQFEQPDGRESSKALVKSERKVAGMAVHEVQLSGTYVAETAPGSGVRVNKAGFRMLAAILESDHGAYYVKLVGPEKTVQEHAAAFRDFISRVH